MNAFEKKISAVDAYPLRADRITTLQVNMGYKCNLRCAQMLKLPVKNRNSNTVDSFDYAALSNRDIVTAPLCFMCTAGAGASCGGALV